MAQHRCFSKDIVRSDAFLDMPPSTRELYFQLGMEADDRGYISNAKSLIKMIGSTLGDLETLVNHKFVLVRESNLILIKGWRINNSIQPSRLAETRYLDDLKKLFFDENKSYTETPTETPVIANDNILPTNCRQDADKVSIQDKLSKDKLSKDNTRQEKLSIKDERGMGETVVDLSKPDWMDGYGSPDDPF